jgi:DNA invertase Pin-like site-specific DNA recombinase
VVIIEKLDRLARDLMVQETIIADLRKHGFRLVSVAEPNLMANDPTRILVRQMMGPWLNMRNPKAGHIGYIAP